MNALTNHINELKAAEAFSAQSKVFDDIYSGDTIVQYKRQRVRDHILQFAKENASMLELNCGTGDDALFFAGKGFKIHATDASEDMLNVLKKKVVHCDGSITTEQCSYTELHLLKNNGPFHYIYSNLGGLNCTSKLDKVLRSFNELIAPGGVVTLVIISKFCLWETLLIFKGKFKTAFRRFFSKNGRTANVEEKIFKCWYYSPSFIKKSLKKDFELIRIEGLCTIVPPSYIEHFAEKRPAMFAFLKTREDKLMNKWPWRSIGDYFIISFRKR